MIYADLDFPTYIGSPLLAERSAKRGATFDRGKTDTGFAFQSKGFAFQPTEMVFSIIVNSKQGIIFESFYYSKSGLNKGVKWFNVERLMPEGLAKIPCRFISEPSFSILGDDAFKYTAKIETLDPAIYIPADIMMNMCLLDRVVNEIWVKV